MTFVGNSPIEFKNIRHIQPLQSADLSKVLRNSDIFITASQNDPCSNSLIEALHCGLPALVLNSGGHPEIVQQGGEVFDTKEQMPLLIEKIVNNYELYQNRIAVPTIEQIGKEYYDAIVKVCQAPRQQKFGIFKYHRLFLTIKFWNALGRILKYFYR
jgi:glycosyltransferase involved in cell wall biosynthesis